MPRPLILVLVTIALAVLPASAQATAWFAGPAGEADGNCSSLTQVCPLWMALADTEPGDTVYAVAGLGAYQEVGAVTVPSGVSLVGVGGQAVIRLGGGSLVVQPGAAASNLELIGLAGAQPVLSLQGDVTSAADGSRLLVSQLSPSAEEACELEDATLSDSVCFETAAAGAFAAEASGATALDSDTLWGGGVAALHALAADAPSTIAVSDDIVRGGPDGLDLDADADGQPLSVPIDHSNLANVLVSGTATFADVKRNASDQTAPPLLAAPDQDDFAELPASPTIGAGAPVPADGPLDLAGNPRQTAISYWFTYGAAGAGATATPTATLSATDIGALQSATTPTVSLLPVRKPTDTSASLQGVVSPGVTSAQTVSAALGGLAPATGNTATLHATSAAGSVASAPVLFKTALPPLPDCHASLRVTRPRHQPERSGSVIATLRLACPGGPVLATATVEGQLHERIGRRMRSVALPGPLVNVHVPPGSIATQIVPLPAWLQRDLDASPANEVVLRVVFRNPGGAQTVKLVLRH